MMRALLMPLMLGVLWFAAAPPAHAIGCILLGCDCSVTALDIEFDDINPLTGTTQSADGQIDIYCTGILSVGAGVIVELDDGEWGTYAARRMKSIDGDFVEYNIYQPDQPSVVWGDGTLSSEQLVVAGGLINLGAWSRSRSVPATMTVTPSTVPGDYEDTVVVRVIW